MSASSSAKLLELPAETLGAIDSGEESVVFCGVFGSLVVFERSSLLSGSSSSFRSPIYVKGYVVRNSAIHWPTATAAQWHGIMTAVRNGNGSVFVHPVEIVRGQNAEDSYLKPRITTSKLRDRIFSPLIRI